MRELLTPKLKRLRGDTSGLATIEFAFVSLVMMYTILNGVEVARWSLQRMQVANAVNSATQAVWNACTSTKLPATTKCTDATTGMTAAITAGLQSTSLGSDVTLDTGFPSEAYYCLDSDGVLTKVGEVADPKPADCSEVDDDDHAPGDYVMISASYTFTPLFPGMTVADLLPTDMTSSGSMRLI